MLTEIKRSLQTNCKTLAKLSDNIKRKFVENTSARFTKFCEQQKENADIDLLLHWLVQNNFIPKEEIKISFVVEEVNNISFCKNISKTAAVRHIEAEHGIPESTQFYILKEHQKRHYKK